MPRSSLRGYQKSSERWIAQSSLGVPSTDKQKTNNLWKNDLGRMCVFFSLLGFMQV